MTNFSLNEYKSMFLEPLRIVEPISWIKHIPFAFFITELLKPEIVVELGVHTGNSFSAFCQAVKNLNVKASCYGVDIFKGDPHSGVYDESVYIDINNYITENYGGFAQVMRMTFDEALEYFSDGSIDLLHIDGYHTYKAVKLDFESWLPKMSDRGVILLHDTQVRRDEFGAWKLWGKISKSYPSYEFKFGYGLGVLAVGKNVPDEIIKFIDEAREKVFIERLFFTLGSNIEFRTRIQSIEGEAAEIRNTIAQKDERIREFEVSLEDRNQHIQSLEGEVSDIRNTIAQKDERIREVEASLEDRNQHIQRLEGEVSDIRNTIAQKDERIREFEVSLEDRNQHIQSLEGEVAEVRNTIAQKEERVRELEVSLEDRNQHIQSLEGEVAEVRNTIAQKDDRIREFEMENLRINTELNSIKSSVTWRTVMKWHSFIEKLMPPMTRRRRWYDLGIIGLRTIGNEGWGSFWWKFREHRASKKFVGSRIESPKLDILSEDFERKVDLINKKVSIVIPTKNAHSDFEFTLEKIENQKGIEEIEMIIVDSGSTDETVKLAEKYGAKVYSIKPDEFNHGLTRNYGAEKATGDYILFMVQDAIPIGDYWLYNMVKVLESDSQIAAATCRQVPRSDADLFACFSIWNHHKALDFYEDRIAELTGDFDKLPPIEKRKLCGLDDMCNLVRKDVFDKFKFKKIQYAEDIDLGLKLIKGGHKLAFLHSVGVVHSHNRDASYFLRRYYVDNKILQGIFNYREYYPESNFDEFLYSILALYSALNLSAVSIKDFLQHTSDGNRHPDAIIKLEWLIQENLKATDIKFNGDQFLNEFFHKIDEIIVEKRTNDKLMNFVLAHYLNQLNDLKKFIAIYNPTEEDFIATLYNLFSIVVASALAIKLAEYNDNRVYIIESLLGGGV